MIATRELFCYRPKTKQNAKELAPLINSAGEGIPPCKKGTEGNGTYLSPNVGRVSVIGVTRQALRSNT